LANDLLAMHDGDGVFLIWAIGSKGYEMGYA
jgi:hypothetical protein